MKHSIVLTLALFCAEVVQAVTIDMATIGNPGNAPDTRYNSMAVGSVGYSYQIGKYEITSRQYTDFLNAVAKSYPHGLYNEVMSSKYFASPKIERTGISPHYNYTVAPDFANRPMISVSFWNAARFCNWL